MDCEDHQNSGDFTIIIELAKSRPDQIPFLPVALAQV